MPEMRRSSALIALSELEVGAYSTVVTLNFSVLGSEAAATSTLEMLHADRPKGARTQV